MSNPDTEDIDSLNAFFQTLRDWYGSSKHEAFLTVNVLGWCVFGHSVIIFVDGASDHLASRRDPRAMHAQFLILDQ